MMLPIAAGLLAAAGVYLVLAGGLVRLILGFVMLGHAANVVLMAAGGTYLRAPALVTDATPEQIAGMADPLPQAFALTAIVIAFAITVYLLSLVMSFARDAPEADDDGTTAELPQPANAATQRGDGP